MAKKGRTFGGAKGAAAKKPASTDDGVAALLRKGSELFVTRDYEGAVEAWTQAAARAPATSEAHSLARCNLAAVHMVGKRYEDAVRECSAALIAQPSFHKALVRRSKAYEALGKPDLALADLARANRLDVATAADKAQEARLRAAGAKIATAAPREGQQQQTRPLAFRCKLESGEEVRQCVLHPNATYVELLEFARAAFPKAWPFRLTVHDEAGEWVTVTSRVDIQLVIQDAISAARKAAKGGQVLVDDLPAIRFRLASVAAEADVPEPPAEEVEQLKKVIQQLEQQAARDKAAEQGGSAAATGEAAGAAAGPPAQVDDWILTFVDLLKEHCGVDPDRPLEASEVGSERLQAGFQSMLTGDAAKADELLSEASAKFQDQVCFGMYNQATVEQYRAEHAMYEAARKGEPLSSVAAEAEAKLARADAHHVAALAYKPGFLDGYLGRSAVEQLRGKLAAGYVLVPQAPKTDVADPAERAAAEEEATRAEQKRAAAAVAPGAAAAAAPHFAAAVAFVERALEEMPADEAAKELPRMKPTAEQVPNDPANEILLKASVLINLGNVHYEHSLVVASEGGEWRPLVERAAELFREAGAHEQDIRAALKGHPEAAAMADLVGPEPEEDAAAAEPAAEPAADAAAAAAAESDGEVVDAAEAKEAEAAAAAKKGGLGTLPKKGKKGGK